MSLEELTILPQLENEIRPLLSSGRFPHAVLLEDEDGERRLNSAKFIACALVCEGGGSVPCGHCRGCIKAASGSHPDIQTVSAPDSPNGFKVDMVREIRSYAYIVPNEADRKVYILDNAHRMSVQAQNALLKVLEEPPEYVCFLLLAPDKNAFLQTILSRCTVFSQRGERQGQAQALEAAVSLAGALVQPHEFALLAATSPFERDKDLLRGTLEELAGILRRALLKKNGALPSCEDGDIESTLCFSLTTPALMRMMDAVHEVGVSLDRNENYNLLLTRMCAVFRAACGK